MGNLREWFKEFWRYVRCQPTDPILWHCKPLLIVTPRREVLERFDVADVVFTPAGAGSTSGTAEIVNREGDNALWHIEVDRITINRGRRRSITSGREGVTLFGKTGNKRVRWHTDGLADRFYYELHHGLFQTTEHLENELSPDADNENYPIG